ncbi:hypothetical protein H0H92_000435 [Tricholoma furcatifolium]|nr:hypothetical protein H0H92_000435 [Tricholoma furcatifolium]
MSQTKAQAAENPALVSRLTIAAQVCIKDYLRDLTEQEVFENPLTDYEYDSDDNGAVPSPCTPPRSMQRPLPCIDSSSMKKKKDKARSSFRRALKRETVRANQEARVKQVAIKRAQEALKCTLSLDFDMGHDVAVSSPGYIGVRADSLPRRQFTHEELVEEYGMTHFAWNGRTTHLLVDREHRIIGVLLGRPRASQDWDRVCEDARSALEAASRRMSFTPKEKTHRRGSFPAVAHGISYGGGQRAPPGFATNTASSTISSTTTSVRQPPNQPIGATTSTSTWPPQPPNQPIGATSTSTWPPNNIGGDPLNSPSPMAGMSVPHRHGSATPPPVSDILSSTFVDAVANRFGFGDEEQEIRTCLHDYIGAGLSKPFLASQVFHMAFQYRVMKNMFQASNHGSQKLQSMFTDKTLRETQEHCQLVHIFKNPNRERVLLSAIKTQCRVSKNALREMLRDSVIGDSTSTLDDFCHMAANRFKRGGAGFGVGAIERARMSVLRRFTHEHPHLVNVLSLEDERSPTPGPGRSRTSTPRPESRADTPVTDSTEANIARPLKRKRTDGYAGGRPQKGHDYWSAVDSWFKVKLSDWGSNWGTPQWQEYMAATIQWDASQFPPDEQEIVYMSGANNVSTPPSAPGLASNSSNSNGVFSIITASTGRAQGSSMLDLLAELH